MDLDNQLRRFLAEDLAQGDVTSEALFAGDEQGAASLVAREELICSGVEAAARVFSLLDGRVQTSEAAPDGARIQSGWPLLQVSGPVLALLGGERVALNLLQHLCGIATQTARYVEAVAGLPVRIVDTRKTTPGLRFLEKAAVRAGGGRNHRFNLADGVLIKDNHIAACGGIAEAVRRARGAVHHLLKIEVECDSLEQVRECLDHGVEVILLDNMHPAHLREAVALVDGRALLEASGGVNLGNVRDIAETGVDLISIGGLTHSARSCDIGMDWS